MTKIRTVLLLTASTIVAAGLLSGCSSGNLPAGGTAPASAGGAATTTKPSPSAAASDDITAVPADCPKASDVSALAGFTVPDPKAIHSGSNLLCTSAGSNPSNDMQINFHPAASGTAAATVKAELLNGKSGVTLTSVTNLRQAAYTYAGSPGGAAILVWNGGVEFSVVDGRDVDSVHRVALGILVGN